MTGDRSSDRLENIFQYLMTAMASASDYHLKNLIYQQILYDDHHLHQQTKNSCKAMERMTMTAANTLGTARKLFNLKEDVSKGQFVDLLKN